CRRRSAPPGKGSHQTGRAAKHRSAPWSRRRIWRRSRPRRPGPDSQPAPSASCAASEEDFLPTDYLLLHHRSVLFTCVEPVSPASVTSGAASASSRLPATVTILLLWSVVWPSLYFVPATACLA